MPNTRPARCRARREVRSAPRGLSARVGSSQPASIDTFWSVSVIKHQHMYNSLFASFCACTAVAPKHPFAATLVNWGHSHFFDIAAFASFDESALNSYSIFSLVVYDAITAVAQERPLEMCVPDRPPRSRNSLLKPTLQTRSDSELANLGWDTDPWAAAPSFYALLLDPDAAEKNKKLHRLRAGATLLRALAQHQSLGEPFPGCASNIHPFSRPALTLQEIFRIPTTPFLPSASFGPSRTNISHRPSPSDPASKNTGVDWTRTS